MPALIPAAVGIAGSYAVGKALQPKAPKIPDPIDPGQSQLDYLLSISDPKVQDQILAAERRGRDQYLELGLRDMQGMMEGYAGQEGTLSMLERMSPRLSDIQSEAMTQQRGADIEDVERYGARATEALRASDPEMQELLQQQGSIVDQLFGRAQGVTPQQQRLAQQQARSAGQARGRGYGEGTMAGEILGREQFQQQNRQEYMGAAGQRFGMLRQTAADPFQAILGRPSQILSQAQQQQGFGAQAAQSFMGPQLFNPDAGINLALQQQGNRANYNANMYGAQAGMQGGLMQGIGGIMGGVLGNWG